MTQTTINGGAAIVGVSISYAFGQWTEVLSFFLLAIVIDIATGIWASIHEGRGVSSAIATSGAQKKALMFLAILLAHRMDVLMALDNVIMTGAVYFYLANELVSITENYGRLGLPLPDGIKRIITVLKNRGEQPKG